MSVTRLYTRLAARESHDDNDVIVTLKVTVGSSRITPENEYCQHMLPNYWHHVNGVITTNANVMVASTSPVERVCTLTGFIATRHEYAYRR